MKCRNTILAMPWNLGHFCFTASIYAPFAAALDMYCHSSGLKVARKQDKEECREKGGKVTWAWREKVWVQKSIFNRIGVNNDWRRWLDVSTNQLKFWTGEDAFGYSTWKSPRNGSGLVKDVFQC